MVSIYIIVSYDVKAEKCIKVMKLLRKYLFHIQNSVFEGELTTQAKNNLISDINKIIHKEDGNVLMYTLPSEKPLKKLLIGNSKAICKTII
ncbi:MAG: CRISPR-associated endonuclease Cas2 [Clostridia bacterium]